jgi:aldehyde dehydrogenase (NAD+)
MQCADPHVSPRSRIAEAIRVGNPFTKGINIGPPSSKSQFEKVERLIGISTKEGATLIAGGPGRLESTTKGYFARPTVFAEVRNDMTIARKEIFGPVFSLSPYENEDDGVRIAEDTPYGLSGFVTSGKLELARRVASEFDQATFTSTVARPDFAGCIGGYKQSGNGREWGEAGLEEFLELKAVFGYASAVK